MLRRLLLASLASATLLCHSLAAHPVPQSRPSTGARTLSGRAIRSDTGGPVSDALLLLRTGDESVDFAQTWNAIGGEAVIDRLIQDQRLRSTVRQHGGWIASRTARSGKNGEFQIEIPEDAVRFSIEAEAPGLLCVPKRPQLVGAPESQDGFLVILDPARTVRGRVIRPDGQPIAGAWISSSENRGWGASLVASLPQDRRSDADGNFEFLLERGMHPEMRAWAPTLVVSHESAEVELELPNEESSRKSMIVVFPTPTSVRARVTDSLERPLGNALLRLEPESGRSWSLESLIARTDSNGLASWPAVLPGEYAPQILRMNAWTPLSQESVVVSPANAAAIQAWRAQGVETSDLLDLSRAEKPTTAPRLTKLEVSVRDKISQQPIRAIEWLILPTLGVSTALPDVFPAERSETGRYTSSYDREVRWAGNKPTYLLFIRAAGYDDVSVTIPEIQGSVQFMSVEMQRSCSILGTVYESEGGDQKRKGGIQIRWRPIPTFGYGLGYYSTVTASDGSFRLTGVPSGPVQVIAYTPGRAEAHSEILTLEPGEVRTMEPMTLRKGGAIQGEVTDGSGLAVPNIGISAEIDLDLKDPNFPLVYSHHVVTDKDGRFYLRGLLPGRWKLQFGGGTISGPPGWDSAGKGVLVREGETTQLGLQKK